MSDLKYPGLFAIAVCVATAIAAAAQRHTTVAIEGQKFLIDGQPTYKGTKVEGLLLNARLVQAIFDDLNPATRPLWKYPDGREFDAQRNTDEFLAALPVYRKAGLISFTVNLQGG